MGFNLVFFTFVLHLIFFLPSVFPLGNESGTEKGVLDNPLDESIEASTELDEVKFFTKYVTSALPVYHDPFALCPLGVKCGFQYYDEVDRKPDFPFLKYCTCAEGFQCTKAGKNENQRYFYYRCKEVGPEVKPIPTKKSDIDKIMSDLLSLEKLFTSTKTRPSRKKHYYTFEEFFEREEL